MAPGGHGQSAMRASFADHTFPISNPDLNGIISAS
jgi:hypothetical protein